MALTVTNTKGFDLLKTGSNGTKLFYGLGALADLIAAGSAIVLLRKKHEQA